LISNSSSRSRVLTNREGEREKRKKENKIIKVTILKTENDYK
jgi:hypothetical protein